MRLCIWAHLISKTAHSRTTRLLHRMESRNVSDCYSSLGGLHTRISIPSQHKNEVMDLASRAVFLELKLPDLPDYASPQVSVLSSQLMDCMDFRTIG
jgi:hypothetical protein